MLLNILNMRFKLCYIPMALYIIKLVQVPLSKMVELKENFVIFLTLFVLFFFLPKFLPHFGVKLLFMLFMRLIAFQALSSIIRLRMSDFLGHPLTIITFAPLDLLVSFFFNKSTTAVANIEPTPSMASISAESQSSGSTINLSPTELQEIITQAVRMVGNASPSTAFLVLPGKSQT